MNLTVFNNKIDGTYADCQNAFYNAIDKLRGRSWESYCGGMVEAWARYSAYDIIDWGDANNESKVKYPDFNNAELICEGACKVRIQDWDQKETILFNPTIKDVLNFFVNNHDGHHGYFEGVKNVGGVLYLYGGS